MSIRIILADDHNIMREGLRTLLEHHTGFEIVAEADNGHTTVELTKAHKPDIVVMDISMPDLNGIEATRQIISEVASVKVIGLSMHSDKRFIANMLSAGAMGYLRKNCDSSELIHAIETVAAGHVYLGQKIVGIMAKDFIQHAIETNHENSAFLTSKEREILQLIAEGKPTKQIALHLNISEKTVEKHRQNLMNKLDIHNVADLTKYAIREGLTSLEDQ